MTEWGVVGVIVVLIGFAVSLITPVVKLCTVVTKLSVTVENLAKSMADIENKNRDSHKRLHNRVDFVEGKLNNHENRICILEECSNHDSPSTIHRSST